jgi:tRNA U34 5-methylaminomethyl-2-thiouridine-forming methyltransferase MnmC
LKREIITTSDGSTSIHIHDWNESYHSKHGAIQEAKHVFIDNGLEYFQNLPISILEIGFGTGLNAFISFIESERKNQNINYTGVEAYPVTPTEVASMNYVKQLNAKKFESEFIKMHNEPWEQPVVLSQNFSIIKKKMLIENINDYNAFDLIYFDAFGFRVQPELWRTEIFIKMYQALKPNGVLVTYAAKGDVRRSMLEVGFMVEKLPGPPGKREMLRAVKKEK